VDDSHVLITSIPESNKEHVKCIVYRIPNDFRIADKALVATVLPSAACPLNELQEE
jgi:hypothetical protein